MQILGHWSLWCEGAGSSPLWAEGLIPLQTLTLEHNHQHITTLTLSPPHPRQFLWSNHQELHIIIIYTYSYHSWEWVLFCPVLIVKPARTERNKPKSAAWCRQIFLFLNLFWAGAAGEAVETHDPRCGVYRTQEQCHQGRPAAHFLSSTFFDISVLMIRT